jgi:AcrR family transcriptional regulator
VSVLIGKDAPERRWGSKERLANEDARERLLNAAEACFERYGLRRTTIDDVAREAKVSRSTVYRYFDGRGDLIVGAYMRESAAVNAKLRMLLDEPAPFVERLVKATLRSIAAIRRGKYLPLMLTPEGAVLASKAVTASTAFYESTRETMGPYLEQAKANGEVRTELDLDEFNEWMLRIVFSFAMIGSPSKQGEAHIRHMLETFLVPAIEPAPVDP